MTSSLSPALPNPHQPPPPPPVPPPFRLLRRENRSVATKLVLYTVVMFTFPLFVFFFVRDHVLGSPDVDFASRNNWSVGCAVFACNLVIAAYVYSAFNEPETEEDKREREARERIKTRTD